MNRYKSPHKIKCDKCGKVKIFSVRKGTYSKCCKDKISKEPITEKNIRKLFQVPPAFNRWRKRLPQDNQTNN